MEPDKYSHGGDVSANAPHNAQTNPNPAASQAAAANVIRSQIDALYSGPGGSTTPSVRPQTKGPQPQTTPQVEIPNVYDRTHQPATSINNDKWQEYHSAWQNYYQTYYKQYYSGATQASSGYFSSQPNPDDTTPNIEDAVDPDEAVYELRQKLVGKVQESAKKIRKSRHFVPIVAAILVVFVFVFLQYNRVMFAWVNAYVSPGSIDVQNIVIDPAANLSVGPEPRLIIPKINVDVPVLYDVGNDHNSQMAAMEKGVAHFSIPGASSHPGEIGNTVLSGHSSNDLFDIGDYKFIFAQLERLQKGDTIYANYEGKRYTYVVTKTEVVKPHEVDKLIYPTEKPVMTLITCTPLGTALNRLLVTAEQVSPDPAAAAPAPQDESSSDRVEMPGNSPTLLERLFGR